MDRDFALHLLTANRPLLRAILSFNGLDSAHAFPESVPDALADKIRSCPQLLRRIGRQNTTMLFDFNRLENRFVFLDADTIGTLERDLSACINARIILGSIMREDVLAWQNALGEDAYRLAIGRGMLYMTDELRERFGARKPEGREVDQLLYAGRRALTTIAAAADAEYRPRIAVTAPDLTPLPLEDEDRGELLQLILKILFTEVDSSCRELFTN